MGSCPFPVIKWTEMTSTGIIAKSVPRSRVTSQPVHTGWYPTWCIWPTLGPCTTYLLFRPVLKKPFMSYSVCYENSTVGNLYATILVFQKIHEIPVTKVKWSSIFSPWCGGDKKQSPLVNYFYIVFRWKNGTEKFSLEVQTTIHAVIVMIITTTFAALLLLQAMIQEST